MCLEIIMVLIISYCTFIDVVFCIFAEAACST